jgi:hypothetical protein
VTMDLFSLLFHQPDYSRVPDPVFQELITAPTGSSRGGNCFGNS